MSRSTENMETNDRNDVSLSHCIIFIYYFLFIIMTHNNDHPDIEIVYLSYFVNEKRPVLIKNYWITDFNGKIL